MASANASQIHADGQSEEQIRQLLQKLDGALENYSNAKQWHIIEILLGMAIAGIIWWLCRLWYQGALSRRQKKKRMQRAVEAINDMDPEELKRLFREANLDLPAWLLNPDFERPSWVNGVIEQLWPRMGRIAEERLKAVMEQVLDENSPRWITSVKLTRLSMGEKSPEITSVKVYKTSVATDLEEVTLDCDFLWNGDQEMQLLIKPLPRQLQYTPLMPAAAVLGNLLVLKVAMEDVTMSGKMRVAMRPLLDRPPVVGALKFSLIQPPKYHYNLTLYGGDLTLLPGVEAWLDSVIDECVIQSYMIPEGYVVPLVSGDLAYVDLPQGILFVRLIEAVNIPKTDWLGKCDPYVVMWTRPSRKSKSPVRHATYHPRWDDSKLPPYVFLVQEPDIQRLHVELWDWDVTGREKVGTGETSLIKELPAERTQDIWVPIKLECDKKDKGDIMDKVDDTLSKVKQSLRFHRRKDDPKVHLKVTYQPIGREEIRRIKEHDDPDYEHEDDQVHDYLKGGILYVYIKQAMHLVRKRIVFTIRPSSQVKVRVNGQVQNSSVGRGKHGDLTFDDRLEFILPGHQAHDDDLMVHFEVWDHRLGVDTFQGRLNIPLAEVRRQRHLKGDYQLEGVRQGVLKLELQWLGILEGGG